MAVQSSLGVVFYLALFAAVGLFLMFVALFAGRFLRPHDPHEEKVEIYECGEPTIGSSFVQFDLRFYVVALLFIVFDVEVAFFFPWATIFGKARHLSDARLVVATADGKLSADAKSLYRELGVRHPKAPSRPADYQQADYQEEFGSSPQAQVVDDQAKASFLVKDNARWIMFITLFDIAVFFAVLMVGFAYVWRRGDLDWVRAVSAERAAQQSTTSG